MDIANLIVKGVTKIAPSVKDKPEVIAFIDKHAAKTVYGIGVVCVGAGGFFLVRGASKDRHILGDLSDAMTSYKAELIEKNYSDAAKEVYIQKRNTVVKTTVGRLVRTYGPGATMIFAGEILQGIAFGSVNGKLASTTGALVAANAFISQVSKRTESKFGKTIRDELFYGGHTVEDIVAEIDGEGKPTVKKNEKFVLDEPVAPVRWTFDYQDSDLFRPNDGLYNPDLLIYWNNRFRDELHARMRNSAKGIGYMSVNEILETMRFKYIKDIPEITRLTYGIIASDFDHQDEIFSWRPVDLTSETTDGQKFVEQTYLIEIRNVVYLPDYLKDK